MSPAAIAVVEPRVEDAEEYRLAEVDLEFTDMYGGNQAAWKPWQVDTYLAALDEVHAEFAPQHAEVAA